MKSESKVKGFNIGQAKPGRVTLKKLEEEHKKKEEEEQTKQVFKEFVATFEGTSKTRTWVKGGVVSTGSDGTSVDASSAGRLYKPVSKFDEKSSRSETIKAEPKVVTDKPEKPSLGKRRGQEQKKSKLEQFKEELKLIQQQREQRHALRQGRNSPPMGHSELDLSDVGGRGRDYRSSSAFNQYNSAAGNSPSSGFYGRRGMRDRRDDYPYDFDGDRTTTNLFLGNLNPKMTEQQLCEAFGRYGPLASVKIMWPRTEEERSRGRNCGFVAFMNRQDGERALDNIRGKELLGFEMKLGWGKSVPIPLYPIYIPPTLLELVKPPPPSGLPFNAQPREWLKSVRRAIKERAKMVADGTETSVPPGPDRKPFDINQMTSEELKEVLKDAVVKVVIPSDRSILALIHRMIEFVVLEGPQFEAAIMHREQNNPQFKFLFDYQSSEHTYYRWKLWSILHGESVNNWRTEEFRMFEGGPLWRPPPMNLFSGGMPEDLVEEDDYPYAPGYVPPPQARRGRDSDGMYDDSHAEASAVSRRCGLTEAQRGRFTQMLSDLEPSRGSIGDVMVWCLEHADSAADITDCIIESFSLALTATQQEAATEDREKSGSKAFSDETKSTVTGTENSDGPHGLSITKLVARLFLVSDILYNSSAKVPNASYFRKCFEEHLPDLFKLLHSEYENVEGKLKAEQLKQKVMVCFRAWEDWAVYPNEYLIKLQNIFLGLVTEIEDEAELAGVPLESNVIQASVIEDPNVRKLTTIDPDVEVLGGQPLVQYDGDPLDVDGSPISREEEQSPPRERPVASLTGTESDRKSSKPTESKATPNRLFVPSKWETVDPEVVESEAVTTTNKWELLVDSTSQDSGEKNLAAEKPRDVGRWASADDDELDGQPLNAFGGLVAYDDEDGASPVPSEPETPITPKSTSVKAITPKTTAPSTPVATTQATVVSAPSAISEERRAQLREVELKVLKYQDELEGSRKGDSSITDEAINRQIQRYRERLLERLKEDERTSPSSNKGGKTSDSKGKSSSKSSKYRRDRSSTTRSPAKHSGTKSHHSMNRDRSFSPAVHRDSRDRSPPRSFRDRARRVASPGSTYGTEADAYDSPSSNPRPLPEDLNDLSTYDVLSYSGADHRRQRSVGWESDNDVDRCAVSSDVSEHRAYNYYARRGLNEELEEGEATDEEDSGSAFNVSTHSHRSKRKYYSREVDRESPSPGNTTKRHRSRSPAVSPSPLRHSHRSRTPSPSRRRSLATDAVNSRQKRR
ncbi:unnamed protein product [Calicophoron daubneyi]|uniref:U2 snRNP-associated SURP motif-containing protein n=1 Tax=Calicophoron daubneyi TaxID=300641 RepID=A0AAV2T801_CALDB